jgi:hypothetical protein
MDITKIRDMIIIKQRGNELFISSSNSLIISTSALAYLLSFLVKNGFISPKLLIGVLEDYSNDYRNSLNDKQRG